MSTQRVKYRDPGEVSGDCPMCVAWHAEVQRVSLLLERLAEDHFPDQAAFDAWIERQMVIALRRHPAAPRAHDTDSFDCWCAPRLYLPCGDCDSGCWKCDGGKIELTREQAAATDRTVMVVHNAVE